MDGDAMRLFASGEIRDREGRFFVTNQGLIPTHNQTNLQGRTRYASMTICSRQQSASPRSECGGGLLLLVFSFGFFLFSTLLGFFHKHLRACSYRFLFPSHSLGYFGVWSKYLVSFFNPSSTFRFFWDRYQVPCSLNVRNGVANGKDPHTTFFKGPRCTDQRLTDAQESLKKRCGVDFFFCCSYC